MRSRKTKGTSRGSKRTRTVAKPKRTSAQAKRSAPKKAPKAPAKSPALAKAQTKTPPKKATHKNVSKTKNVQSKRVLKKKEYEKPMALMLVRIKDHNDQNGGIIIL